VCHRRARGRAQDLDHLDVSGRRRLEQVRRDLLARGAGREQDARGAAMRLG
jgi:hypothetical protein